MYAVLLLIFVVILFYLIFNNEIEKYENCPFDVSTYWTVCPRNSSIKCKKCGYKRVGLDYQIDAECCENKCIDHGKYLRKVPERIFLGVDGLSDKLLNPKWWCKNLYSCFERNQLYYGKKWCGLDMNNQPAKIYNDKESCMNEVNKYEELDRYKCLRTTGAGWCTDSNGNGKCVEGTPDRPRDILRYGYCYPNRQCYGTNSYIAGNGDPFVIKNFANNDI